MKFKLDIKDLGKKQWIGIIEKSDDWFNEKYPACQKCHCPIMEPPYYVCEEKRYNWFCKECQTSEEPSILCDFDKNLLMRSMGNRHEEHMHICVKELMIEKEEEMIDDLHKEKS